MIDALYFNLLEIKLYMNSIRRDTLSKYIPNWNCIHLDIIIIYYKLCMYIKCLIHHIVLARGFSFVSSSHPIIANVDSLPIRRNIPPGSELFGVDPGTGPILDVALFPRGLGE